MAAVELKQRFVTEAGARAVLEQIGPGWAVHPVGNRFTLRCECDGQKMLPRFQRRWPQYEFQLVPDWTDEVQP